MRVERVFSIRFIFGTVTNLCSWISDDVDEERDERCGLKNRLSFRFNVVHLKNLGGESEPEIRL